MVDCLENSLSANVLFVVVDGVVGIGDVVGDSLAISLENSFENPSDDSYGDSFDDSFGDSMEVLIEVVVESSVYVVVDRVLRHCDCEIFHWTDYGMRDIYLWDPRHRGEIYLNDL